MKRIHELSRLSQFLLFFVTPACFALGAFQMIDFSHPPTLFQEALAFCILYALSLGVVAGCFYFVQGVKGFTAWSVEKQRLRRKRQT